jgi:hypothetical protein
MPVHHVDVTGTPTLLPRGPAAAGSPLWVEIRPDLKRSAAIASDILGALGKRRDVAGRGRNENQDVELAQAWLGAYDITALVATEAQRLTPLVLRNLVALAREAGLPLWLLHRSPRSDRFIQTLGRHHAHPLRLSDVPAPRVATALVGQRPTLGVALPSPGFHAFLSSCRQELSQTGYDKLARRHAAVAARCLHRMEEGGTGIHVIARLVEEILLPAPQDDLLVTDIRALQLAAWHHDIYVKTNIAALLASPERQLADPISVDQALVAYRQPHRPVAVALAAHQIGVGDIAAIRISDASPDGSVMTRGGRRITVGEHGARALNALVSLRTRHGVSLEAALLGVPERAISVALNDANTDLGIRVHGRRAERHVHPRRWLTSLGLRVHELP